MEEREAPRVVVRIRVPFVDVDASARIHFTALFRYMEVAEHALMRSLGLPYATALSELAFPRVHLSCDFRGALHFDDLLDIEARVAHVGTSAWTVAFTARLAPEAEGGRTGASSAPMAEGRMTIVAMDPASARATPLPADLRHALAGT